MKFIRRLPDVEEIQCEYALNETQKKERDRIICEIRNILSGKDNRKLFIVGPCSADREDAVLEYVSKLSCLQEEVSDRFLLIPRVYTSKPRSNGTGYKGLLHSPHADGEEDMLKGIIAARKLHLRVIQETGLYSADEMLYPEEIYYLVDLLCYTAVGARSTEDQGHRMTASGLDIPVGMKNPTSGNVESLINSIVAARTPCHMIYRGWEVKCEGNPYAHAVLRGYTGLTGKNSPNYHYENICELHDMAVKKGVCNPGVIIDCNHANSNKDYIEQIRIAEEIMGFCKRNEGLNRFIKGLMIESYLEDGKQLVGGGIYGKSITDACLGWDKTEQLIKKL